MELSQVGEFGLIDLLREGTIVDPRTVVKGIGDDCAVVRAAPGKAELLSCDMLVEDVHFSWASITPWQLGYKAVAVNLSDIAAMGGQPRHIVVSLGLPRHLAVEDVLDLYAGMKEICRVHGVNIVGGDTVSSPVLVINIAIVGEAKLEQIVYRSGARPGDLLAVTGTLGDSACGLELLRRGWEDLAGGWKLVLAHLAPQPKLAAGRALAAAGVSALDDISDGLASETNEIAAASGVGMRVQADLVPLSAELKAAAVMLGRDPLDFALFGGEDYQLLFTISPDRWSGLPEVLGGEAVTVIGQVTPAEEGVMIVYPDGKTAPLAPGGYNHFR